MAEAASPNGTTRADAWRNALAIALAATLYGGLFVLLFGLVPFGKLTRAGTAFVLGYLAAVVIHAAGHGALRLLGMLGARVPELAASLGLLAALPPALGRLFTAADLPAFAGSASFVGAGIALLFSDEFPTRLRDLLLAPDRLRAGLGRRPRLRARLLRAIRPLMVAGHLLPWLAAVGVLLALPPGLRAHVTGYLVMIAVLLQLLARELLEELVVWGFTQAVYAGDYEEAMRLPLRLQRLAWEIEQAPPDLETPLAGYVAFGLNGPERFPFGREAMERLVKVFVTSRPSYGSEPASAPAEAADGLVRALLACGLRFSLAAEGSDHAEAEVRLPRFRELRDAGARRRLTELFPGEPAWRMILRRYERDVRGALFPVALLWLVLPLASWPLRATPFWPVPLALAAASFVLMLWLIFLYSQWAFDESLRRRDFDFLAQQLGRGLMFGELEDALGSRSPRVRHLAVELLLFHDGVVSQGITVPPAGLRKFLRRAP